MSELGAKNALSSRSVVEDYLPAFLTSLACHVRPGEQVGRPHRFPVRDQILPEARVALIPLEREQAILAHQAADLNPTSTKRANRHHIQSLTHVQSV
jgi:hypothetical protein